MAVTNIHTIHKGAYNAVAYICNPDKTDNGKYVVSNLCVSSPSGASRQFKETREFVGGGRSRNEAQHIIQSFAPNEVTPERALLIGQELCKDLFNDEYQYVLATHVDHSHVHNHIILCNVNFYTGKSFETEHNQGKIPERAWAKLREISDDLCKKNGLSTIENAEQSRGQSHWEWEMDQQHLSWKAKLKLAIDEVIKVSDSFEDFLLKCADFGILVDYDPNRKYDIKYMLAEQKERNPRAKYTRGKTLGYFYESKQIASRIENYKYLMNNAPKTRIIRTSSDKFVQAPALSAWADRENMKAASKALNEMTASNSTVEELEQAAMTAFGKRMAASNTMSKLRKQYDELKQHIPLIEEFTACKVARKKYLSLTGREKKKYGEQFSYELQRYHELATQLTEIYPEKVIPTVELVQKTLDKFKEQYKQASGEYDFYKKEADRLSKAAQQKRDSQRTVSRYIENEQETKRKKNNYLE